MKLSILLVAFILAQAKAGAIGDVPPTVAKLPECNVGDTFFNGTLRTTEEPQSCSQLETTCQTKVEVGPDSYRIYKQCQTADACENNKQNNPQLCYSEEAEAKQEKVCHFCCQGDFCNDGSEIDVILPTADDFAADDDDDVEDAPVDDSP